MDVSVIAAVGSFFMSERVLKPKATVLFILGIILAYDLTTKTHDVSSLRVYRGPAMVAFTLFMSAFSLRMWRRNGVACDELLFLPGTDHGIAHGVDSPPGSVAREVVNGSSAVEESAPLVPHSSSAAAPPAHSHSEGDIAAGAPCPESVELRRRSRSIEEREPPHTTATGEAIRGGGNNNNPLKTSGDENNHPIGAKAHGHASPNRRSISLDETRANAMINQQNRRVIGDIELVTTATNRSRALSTGSFDSSLGWGSDEVEEDLSETDGLNPSQEPHQLTESFDDEECNGQRRLLCRSNGHGPSEDLQSAAHDGNTSNQQRMDNFRENHPQITRLGTFFFFRSPTTTNTTSAVYAPSGPAVVGAALDLSMPVLFNFHVFIEAFNHIKPKDAESEAPAKILPIIFLSVLIVRSVVPPGRRGRFWSTIKFTVMSPFHRVRFRDAFVGDLITSWVRPGQDILFALSYYVTVGWGSISGNYGLTESGAILEGSWVLHNVILPSCALLPLWWKFLQTLRQAYDDGRRWPHLGNAFKHLVATLVILYGMTHPESKRSSYWILIFILALLYQIFWDVVMDWDLLEIPPHHFRSSLDAISVENWLTNISSLRPDSATLMSLQMHVFTPLAEGWRRLNARLSSLRHIRLRTKRLYKSEAFYWRIFIFNAVTRFTWMLCFIPAYRLSSSGEEKVATFSSDVNSYVGVLLPVAELVRRTFWGILLLERKTIEMTDTDEGYARLDSNVEHPKDDDEVEELIGDDEGSDDIADHVSGGDHSQAGKASSLMYLPLWLNAQQQTQHDSSHRAPPYERLRAYFDFGDGLMHNLFVCELGIWAAAFVGLGCWAAS